MIIHIGENISINENDIVAILDRKTIEACTKNTIFTSNSIENFDLVNLEDDSIKSYIIVSEKSKIKKRKTKKTYKIYVSNISSTSLLKRQEDIDRREIYVE